jgi:hypothetical protein
MNLLPQVCQSLDHLGSVEKAVYMARRVVVGIENELNAAKTEGTHARSITQARFGLKMIVPFSKLARSWLQTDSSAFALAWRAKKIP